MNYGYMAKAIATAIGTGLVAAISYYPHAGWIPIAAAVCTAMATYAIPNTEKQVSQEGSTIQGNLPAPIRPGTLPDTMVYGPDAPQETVPMNFTERVSA